MFQLRIYVELELRQFRLHQTIWFICRIWVRTIEIVSAQSGNTKGNSLLKWRGRDLLLGPANEDSDHIMASCVILSFCSFPAGFVPK